MNRRHLPNSWVELESPDGEIYYANIKTKETSWDPPESDIEDKENRQENVLLPISKIAQQPQKSPVSARLKQGGRKTEICEVPANSSSSQDSRAAFPRFSQFPWQAKHDQTCEESMSVSFVAKESHAVSDLAALADMSVAHLSPRDSQPEAGVGILLEQLEEGGPITVGKIFKDGPAALRFLLSFSPCASPTALLLLLPPPTAPAAALPSSLARAPAVGLGDQVLAVNGQPVVGQTPSELRGAIVGRVGTQVHFRLRKASSDGEWSRGDILEVWRKRGGGARGGRVGGEELRGSEGSKRRGRVDGGEKKH
eukprot:768610-Hanusia_phi.AAC.2